ncbi:acylneuraminate cytidylyltransferase [Photobacterium gaetbulicola]|uniref:N-acylneuraminate cytidylyltransferase n=1 Tax=Photobacterium gaetbulicola Gung47 TaxID=658445 RepID=A0A0C5WT40_9GAMM|nr:GDSL-type esterase/lipase family protein [Photobacterium gaetbulicola]AJR09572.1 N-acylneuraminate cytidylyltransferase [Photobacterium gaetbulicola Gung47]PSU14365.1 acylneuraminate cytidylyltransferase [Photobacterium gaetbulicola]
MSNKIAIIPARSGSKGLPNKNILMLLDKPVLAYTIEAASQSGEFDRIIVSTDSLEYKSIAEHYGAEVIIRDKALASDTATSFMVIADVLEKVSGYSHFALLQPTSPFRTSEHIKQAISLFDAHPDANFLASVAKSDKCSALIKPIDDDLSLKYFDEDFSQYRRQTRCEYSPNGAIFIANCHQYLEKKHFFGKDSIAYIMSKADSIDIDDQLDFELAIAIQSKKNKEKQLLHAIQQRIDDKFSRPMPQSPITLLGHSLFDYWDIKTISAMPVNNLGIAGINTKQYLDFIFDNDLLDTLGKHTVIFAGTNDIVVEGWAPLDTLKWIKETIQKIRAITPTSRIYVISVPPVRGRMDRSNAVIQQLNTMLKVHIQDAQWIQLSDRFYDEFGNLPAEFTTDGLHFSPVAYQQLELEVAEYLQ